MVKFFKSLLCVAFMMIVMCSSEVYASEMNTDEVCVVEETSGSGEEVAVSPRIATTVWNDRVYSTSCILQEDHQENVYTLNITLRLDLTMNYSEGNYYDITNYNLDSLSLVYEENGRVFTPADTYPRITVVNGRLYVDIIIDNYGYRVSGNLSFDEWGTPTFTMSQIR